MATAAAKTWLWVARNHNYRVILGTLVQVKSVHVDAANLRDRALRAS